MPRYAHYATSRLAVAPVHAAIAYAERGWPVFPIHTPTGHGCSCRKRRCPKPGKHPRTERGLADATTSTAQIARWWARWPDANIAIATGRLIVIDIDGPTGRAELEQLQQAHGPLPATRRAVTASGEHRYYDAREHDIPCSVGRLGRGLDVRGRGGYAIAPPSRHATGHRYRWTNSHPITWLPTWLADLLVPPAPPALSPLPAAPADVGTDRARHYLQAALAAELTRVATARPGTRNDTLNRSAFRLAQLAGAGLATLDELEGPLLDAARQAGLPEPEATATIASGLRAGHQHPRQPASRRQPWP